MMSCVNSVQDVHELGDKNEQFKLILRLIFRVENFPTRSKVHTGEDTKSKREKNWWIGTSDEWVEPSSVASGTDKMG